MKNLRKKTEKKNSNSKPSILENTLPKFRVVDLVQKSKEWHDWRREGIGASDQLKIRTLKSTETVLRKKFGIYEAQNKYEEAEQKRRAKILKENETKGYAAEWLALKELKNRGFEMEPLCIESIENPFFRASLDGFDPVLGPIEVKITKNPKIIENFIRGGKKKKGDPNPITGFGFLTDDWLYQCNWIMFLTGFKTMRFYLFDETKMEFHTRRIDIDHEIVKECIQNSIRFQEFYIEKFLPLSGDVSHLMESEDVDLKVGFF
jgi:hypothetical protein